MSIAHWIGARAAEVVAFFRDKPIVPCQVDWPVEEYIDTDEFYGDDCDSCDEGCCLTTDTISEFREWNQRG